MAVEEQVKIATTDGLVSVPAYRTSVPGLIVHRAVDREGWNVTHEPSGIALFAGIGSKQAAIDAASKVSEITDWTQPLGKVSTHEAWEKVKPILEELRSEGDKDA